MLSPYDTDVSQNHVLPPHKPSICLSYYFYAPPPWVFFVFYHTSLPKRLSMVSDASPMLSPVILFSSSLLSYVLWQDFRGIQYCSFAFPIISHGADFCPCYYYFVVIGFPFPSFPMIFLCSPPRSPTFFPLLPVFMCSHQRTSHVFTMLCPCPPQGFPWSTPCCFYALTTFYSDDLPKGLVMVYMRGFTMISNG